MAETKSRISTRSMANQETLILNVEKHISERLDSIKGDIDKCLSNFETKLG